MLLKLRLARIIPPSHIRGKRADPVLLPTKSTKIGYMSAFSQCGEGRLGLPIQISHPAETQAPIKLLMQ